MPGRRARRRGWGISRDGGRGCPPRDAFSPSSAAAAQRDGWRARQEPRAGAGAWRAARAGSLPPPRRFSAAAAPQPGSGGSRLRASRPSPRRGPRKPDAVLGGAGSEDGGGLSLPVTCPLAWASPLPRLDAAASLQAWGGGCFSAGEADSASRLGGALWGEEARARGLGSHPSCRRVLCRPWGRGSRSMRTCCCLSCVCCILPTW